MGMNATRLGTAMYDAIQSLSSGNDAGAAKSRMIAIAGAIISEISANGTISPLSTSSTPAGTGPHTHSPITVSSTGKIS